MCVQLTVDPQSPSPTLLSHSFKLSLIPIIAFAAASIATSRIQPCSLSCSGRLNDYKKQTWTVSLMKVMVILYLPPPPTPFFFPNFRFLLCVSISFLFFMLGIARYPSNTTRKSLFFIANTLNNHICPKNVRQQNIIYLTDINSPCVVHYSGT